jgi:hypothetical protein
MSSPGLGTLGTLINRIGYGGRSLHTLYVLGEYKKVI